MAPLFSILLATTLRALALSFPSSSPSRFLALQPSLNHGIATSHGALAIPRSFASLFRMGIGGSKPVFAPSAIPSSFSAVKVTDIYGAERTLGEWDGKVKLVINVASNCGLTKGHNKELFALREKFGSENFEILAFPCRQFAGQEFESLDDTKAFCERVKIPFPVFATSDVNGPGTNPAVLYCKWNCDAFYTPMKCSKEAKLSDIGWNYGKFLLDRENGVYQYYGPRTKPLQLEEDIRKLIAGEVKGMKRDEDGQLKSLLNISRKMTVDSNHNFESFGQVTGQEFSVYKRRGQMRVLADIHVCVGDCIWTV